MKNFTLSILAVIAVLLVQSCKKSSDDTTTTTTTSILTATVNSVAWAPDTLSATITYNAAAKTKIFAFVGTYNQRQVNCAVTLANATSANDFTIGTYTVDATPNPLMVYSTWQQNSSGTYVFMPVATAGFNEGTLVVTSINSTAGTITGTFNFSHKNVNYDGAGNITTVTNTVVSGGAFTDMPYTFSIK